MIVHFQYYGDPKFYYSKICTRAVFLTQSIDLYTVYTRYIFA